MDYMQVEISRLKDEIGAVRKTARTFKYQVAAYKAKEAAEEAARKGKADKRGGRRSKDSAVVLKIEDIVLPPDEPIGVVASALPPPGEGGDGDSHAVPWVHFMRQVQATMRPSGGGGGGSSGGGGGGGSVSGDAVAQETLLNFIANQLLEKMRFDELDDRDKQARTPLPNFLYEGLVRRHGLNSVAKAHVLHTVTSIFKEEGNNAQIATFGKLCGVLEPENYSARGCDIYLHLLRSCIDVKTSLTFAFAKADFYDAHTGTIYRSPVPTDRAIGAINRVFPRGEAPLEFSIDRMELESDLRSALVQKVMVLSTVDPAKAMAGAGAGTGGGAGGHGRGSGKVIPLFTFLSCCLGTWQTQFQRDREGLRTHVWDKFDRDGDQRLDYSEFRDLLRFCTSNPNIEERLCLRVYKELSGGSITDTISPETFADVAASYGICPPDKQMNGGGGRSRPGSRGSPRSPGGSRGSPRSPGGNRGGRK